MFGVPKNLVDELERHESGSGSSSSALERTLERLIAAGGRLDVDCALLEHINDQEDTATWHDLEYRKLKMARDLSKIFKEIDVLVTLSPTYDNGLSTQACWTSVL